MSPTITKSLLQSNEATAQCKINDKTLPITVSNQTDAIEGNIIGDEVVQQDTQSDMQLESLLTEIDHHGEEFLFCGKYSIQTIENVYENDNVSKVDEAFGLAPTISEASECNQSNHYSIVASSSQALLFSISDAHSSSSLEPKSIMMHADGGSNVILVGSPSFPHNVIKTTNEVGNTVGGTASTTQIGELDILLDTLNKKILTAMKQAYLMISNDHNAFGLSPFLLNDCHRVSHAMNECIAIELANKDHVNIPTT